MTSTRQARSTWTREAWLEAAVETFRPRFVEVGMPLPERVHVSVGFTIGSAAENKNILGSTLARFVSEDGANHVFISPELGDTARVLAVLLHELIHVADDNEHGHRGEFADAAVRFGFTGSLLEVNPSIQLAAELMLIAVTLGDYPHGRVNLPVRSRSGAPAPVGPDGQRITSGPKAQTNRYRVAVCHGTDCDGYRVRMVAKHIERGLPFCGVCGERMQLV